MNRLARVAASVVAALGLSTAAWAAEVVLTGSTIGIDVTRITGGGPVKAEREELQALAAAVTDEYHRRGYTTSHVEKVSVRADGVIEVRVRESRILRVSVSGIGKREADEIENLLVPNVGELYNRNVLKSRMETARQAFNLDTITARPINYEGTGDVFLSVSVRRLDPGRFYGGIGMDPIYGITPYLGWRLTPAPSSCDLKAQAGLRDRLRKAELEARYTRALGEGFSSFFVGADGGMTAERWETAERDYTVKKGAAMLGIGFAMDLPASFLAWLKLYVRGAYASLNDYSREGASGLGREVLGVADLLISNRFYIIEKRDAVSLWAALSYGMGDIEPKGFMITESRLRVPIKPFSFLRLIPKASSYFTDSEERFYHRYIFDGDLLGFAGDFTAARWKLIAGIDAEFEIVPGFFFAGPFVNTGRFLDEEERKRNATGAGIRAMLEYRSTMASVSYAWDAASSPSKGGIYVAAESVF